MNTIDSQIKGGEATCKETPPPPVIVLCTKMEVTEEDGSFRAGYDENQEHNKEKTIHVVNLTTPNAVEYKEELNEDTTEGKDTAHDNSRNRLSVHALLWNLSWYLICSDGLLNRWLPETEISPHKGEGDRNPKPEREQCHQSEEWDGGAAPLVPHNQVQDEEVAEHDTRTQHRGKQHIGLPFLSSERFIDPSRYISSRGAETHEEDKSTSHQRSAVSRGEKAEASKNQRDGSHREQLGA